MPKGEGPARSQRSPPTRTQRRSAANRRTPPTATDPGVDEILRELPRDLRAIARVVRSTVRRNAPGLRERVKWRNPFWVGRSDVACLMIYPDHINLGFLQGARLTEKYPELVGTGKGMRHVKVPTVASARRPVLSKIVRDAVRLDLER